MPRHQSSISLKRLLTKSAGGKYGCWPISRTMTKLGGACLDQSASLAPFSSLSSAVSGRLHFLFIMPYRHSLSPSLSPSLPIFLHSCLNHIPAVTFPCIHSAEEIEVERDDGNGWKRKRSKRGNGAYHLCVCLHKYEFVFVCSWLCVLYKWEFTGSDADILDIGIKNRR